MSTFNSVDEYEIALNLAIDNAMETVIAERAKQNIADTVKSYVYSYTPKFMSRYGASGGLQDTAFMHDTYDSSSKTMIITVDVPWQNLGFKYIDGRGIYDSNLADAVETKQIYGAPPRPFMKTAEQDYALRQFETDLLSALRAAGL